MRSPILITQYFIDGWPNLGLFEKIREGFVYSFTSRENIYI